MTLRLELDISGQRAGLYEGSLLVIGFKFQRDTGTFSITTINKAWDSKIATSEPLRLYLERILTILELFKEQADHLNSLKNGLEAVYSETIQD